MLKKHNFIILFIVLMGTVLITFTGCNDSASEAVGSNNFFTEGTVYAIEGEFDIHREGGIVLGTLFVEILETNDNWIRVDILADDSVDRSIRESTITRAKDEGLFKDLWINTEKIHYVMTEPDISGF